MNPEDWVWLDDVKVQFRDVPRDRRPDVEVEDPADPTLRIRPLRFMDLDDE